MCLKLSMGTCVDDVLDQPVGGPVNILLGHGHLEGVQLLEEPGNVDQWWIHTQ